MDKLEQYRQWIQALLTEYVATPISNGAIEIVPIGFSIFLQNKRVFLAIRETRWRQVLLNLSI